MANKCWGQDPIPRSPHSQPLTLLCSSDCAVLVLPQVAPAGQAANNLIL